MPPRPCPSGRRWDLHVPVSGSCSSACRQLALAGLCTTGVVPSARLVQPLLLRRDCVVMAFEQRRFIISRRAGMCSSHRSLHPKPKPCMRGVLVHNKACLLLFGRPLQGLAPASQWLCHTDSAVRRSTTLSRQASDPANKPISASACATLLNTWVVSHADGV